MRPRVESYFNRSERSIRRHFSTCNHTAVPVVVEVFKEQLGLAFMLEQERIGVEMSLSSPCQNPDFPGERDLSGYGRARSEREGRSVICRKGRE